jgi:type IV pilus assembly protein PilA
MITRSEIRRRREQGGFSLVELLVVIAIILIILFFAVPQYNKARMNAQETGAIAGLKTLYQAQIQYQSQFGDFATSLAQLGPPSAAGGAEGPQSAGLIAGGLAGGNSSGYVFTLTQTPTGYAAVAVPKTYNSTGRRTFYSDQSGVIRQNWGADPATPNSAEVR